MKRKTLVSVIIPFFNAEKFLNEAIESVFAQTFQSWELMLVDDGSTDKSTDIALQYSKRYPKRVRYLQHDRHENRGASASRNLGICYSTGKYIAFLDADDVWFSYTLEKQVATLESHPEAAMVYGSAEWWYSWTGKPDDTKKDQVEVHGVETNKLIPPPTLLTFLLRKIAVPCICTVMVRRDAVTRVDSFEETFRDMYDDQAFYAKIFLSMPVFVSGGCWARYRQHPDSCCAVVRKIDLLHSANLEVRARDNFLQWVAKYFSEMKVSNGEVINVLEMAMWEIWPYHYPIRYRLHSVLYRLHLLKPSRHDVVISSRPEIAYNTSKVPPLYEGYHDSADCQMITGWAWDVNQPDSSVNVEIYANNTLLGLVTANMFRQDLAVAGKGNGCHAFLYFTPPWLKDGKPHSVRVKIAGVDIDLGSTSKVVNCELQVMTDIKLFKAKFRDCVSKMKKRNPLYPIFSWLQAKWKGYEYTPPLGWVRFGSLKRLKPISKVWGLDRGHPIDRYYIESFLSQNADDIRGRVLEIGGDEYTRAFGGDRVMQSDVLNLLKGTPKTTIVADLTNAPQIPSDIFDCIIFTQTLQLIYDVRSAVRTLHRILKPGGVLLATLSGITKTCDREWGNYWCWNFTPISARKLFEEIFLPGNIEVEAYGNVLAAISFLHGLAVEELSQDELDYRDLGYDISITVRAIKQKTTGRV